MKLIHNQEKDKKGERRWKEVEMKDYLIKKSGVFLRNSGPFHFHPTCTLSNEASAI